MIAFKDKYVYWRFLAKMGSELLAELDNFVYSQEQFSTFVLETAGIKINYNSLGMITEDYEVVDAGKLAFVMLKYQ